jgi:hypothetical protein
MRRYRKAVGLMLNSLIGFMFGCSHSKTTFPMTPSLKARLAGVRRGTYIVCLDCGKEFDYDWKEMRVGSAVGDRPIKEKVQNTI